MSDPGNEPRHGRGAAGGACARRAARTPRRRRAGPGSPGISLVPEPIDEADVQAQLEEFDVDAPLVGIVMGSKSDMETMEKAADELEERGILHEVRVMSAHREPDLVAEYAEERPHARPARDHRRRRDLGGAARAPSPPTPTCR